MAGFIFLYMDLNSAIPRSGSVETVGGNSEGTGTTDTSQTPSCRALAGNDICR